MLVPLPSLLVLYPFVIFSSFPHVYVFPWCNRFSSTFILSKYSPGYPPRVGIVWIDILSLSPLQTSLFILDILTFNSQPTKSQWERVYFYLSQVHHVGIKRSHAILLVVMYAGSEPDCLVLNSSSVTYEFCDPRKVICKWWRCTSLRLLQIIAKN